jgi:precorrin-2 dehydrogenase/sirohydrochlorin ferrochelatase
MDDVYPIFLRLKAKPVLIVGGGPVGWRKAEGLQAAGALVTVVSLEFHTDFEQLPTVQRIISAYEPGYLTQAGRPRWVLVFAATNNPQINAQIYSDASRIGVLCCRCDAPQAGDFIGPAVQRCGPVTLAVTSGGASPGLSGDLARQLAAQLDPVQLKQIELSVQWRELVLQSVSKSEHRRNLLQRLSGEVMRDTIRQYGEAGAEALFRQWLMEAKASAAVVNSPATDARN